MTRGDTMYLAIPTASRPGLLGLVVRLVLAGGDTARQVPRNALAGSWKSPVRGIGRVSRENIYLNVALHLRGGSYESALFPGEMSIYCSY
jgi:hypothetical protein